MLSVSWNILPPWFMWHNNILDFLSPLPLSILEMLVLWGSYLGALFTSHILPEWDLFPWLLKYKHSFIPVFFLPSYPYSQPSPGHIYLDLLQISKIFHIRNLTFSCFLSLVINLIEKPYFAPSCPNHSWFFSPSQPLTYSVVSCHKYFKSSSTPYHSHCHDMSPEYRYLLCGFLHQPLTQSPFLHHWVLNQTLPSHQKYFSTFISDDVTLQLENLYPGSII